MLEVLVKILAVLLIGTVEIFAAVPAGFAMRVDPVFTFMASSTGGTIGVAAVVFVGGRFRDWLLKARGKGGEGKLSGRARRIWQRYGVAGFGMVGPMLLGAPLSAALGLALGGRCRQVALWTSIGVVLWCAVLTLAISLGILSAGLFF